MKPNLRHAVVAGILAAAFGVIAAAPAAAQSEVQRERGMQGMPGGMGMGGMMGMMQGGREMMADILTKYAARLPDRK